MPTKSAKSFLHDSTRYAYAVGRIKAREVHLISAEMFSRLALAPNFEETFKLLSETAYANYFSRLKDTFDFESILEMERREIIFLLGKLAPQDHYIKFFISREYDQLAGYAPSPFLRDFARILIDLDNLKMLLRRKILNLKTPSAYLKNGRIAASQFVDLEKKDLVGILSYLKFSCLSVAAGKINFAPGMLDMESLDRAIEYYIKEVLEKVKYIAFGLEPLIFYLVIKEIEIKKIRFILSAKQKGLKPEIIKGKLDL